MSKFTILDVADYIDDSGTYHLTLGSDIIELEPSLLNMTLTACYNIGRAINFNIIGDRESIFDCVNFLLANVSKDLNTHSNIIGIYGDALKLLIPDKSTKTDTITGNAQFNHVNEDSPITADGSYVITTPNSKYNTQNTNSSTHTIVDVNINQQIDAIKLKESIKPIFKIIYNALGRLLEERIKAY